VTGRVGVHLEVVTLGGTASWLEHSGSQTHDVGVGGIEVLDPEIEVDLLRWSAVRPVRRDVVWCVLHADAWFTVDDHHVPVIVSIDVTAEDTGPERALGV
jgi:hypothetical protein